MNRTCDVAVVGGGNAALCAALTAREQGASVVVIECAPRHFRGGNSRHTRNLRTAHGAPTEHLLESYSEDEFLTDLSRANGREMDEPLARLVVRQSAECPAWMASRGARFQSSLRGTLHLSRTNAFFLGGGKALMNTYYAAAARAGIEVLYDTEVVGLDRVGDHRCRVSASSGGRPVEIETRALVLASGGFESNIEWLREAWGDAADNFIIRGTPYNR
jgi:tricarballylate dehydrogenase